MTNRATRLAIIASKARLIVALKVASVECEGFRLVAFEGGLPDEASSVLLGVLGVGLSGVDFLLSLLLELPRLEPPPPPDEPPPPLDEPPPPPVHEGGGAGGRT